MVSENLKKVIPLPLALYCGFDKPDLQDLMKSLIADLKLLKNGVDVLGTVFKLGRVMIVADAPARAMTLCIKSHSAFYGCAFCRQKGIRHLDRIIFPDMRAELRTESDYYAFSENNQICLSPVFEVVSPIDGFPVDYMHLVCLRIVKKIFKCFFDSMKGIRISGKLSVQQKKITFG